MSQLSKVVVVVLVVVVVANVHVVVADRLIIYGMRCPQCTISFSCFKGISSGKRLIFISALIFTMATFCTYFTMI